MIMIQRHHNPNHATASPVLQCNRRMHHPSEFITFNSSSIMLLFFLQSLLATNNACHVWAFAPPTYKTAKPSLHHKIHRLGAKGKSAKEATANIQERNQTIENDNGSSLGVKIHQVNDGLSNNGIEPNGFGEILSVPPSATYKNGANKYNSNYMVRSNGLVNGVAESQSGYKNGAVASNSAQRNYNNTNFDSMYCECEDVDASTPGDSDDAIDELFNSLLYKVASYNPAAVVAPSLNDTTLENCTVPMPIPILRQAYEYARTAHEGQCRKSGEPYITHPLGVAHIIADLKLDLPSLLTALLHDVVEDTSVTLANITNLFGSEVAHIVDGVTKVGQIPLNWSYEEKQSENYRKLILSMSRDIRVLLVKLADRMHNMRTLQYMKSEKQRRIAQETLQIYTPLAHRLGINWLKTELEDTCFKYLYPEDYKMLDSQVKGSEQERKLYEEEVVDMLMKQMKDAGVGGSANSTLQITGRTKGLHSIHSKMMKKNIEFDDVHDVMAFRIIVDDVASCYQALGLVHSHFKPVPGKIKDYIALPKPNGYRSLHTTIMGPRGKLEVQIRTKDMHEVAESGIAAHWMYKQPGTSQTTNDTMRYEWLKELVQEVRRQSDPKEFVKSVKEDLFLKEVFVFSPAGDLYALARGSSVLDFAFKIHSNVGSQCVGAKVNGKQVSMKYVLRNGDRVEIMTSNNQAPKREWLRYVRSSKAKNRIRSWLKRQQRDGSIATGKQMIDEGIRKYNHRGEDAGKKEYQRKLGHLLTTFDFKDEAGLLTALGYGQINIDSVMIEIFGNAVVKTHGKESKKEKDDRFVLSAKRSALADSTKAGVGKTGIIVGKEKNIMLNFCRNCTPLQGENIKGVVSQGRGVKVHRLGCKYLLEADDKRIVEVQWDDDSTAIRVRPVRLQVMCEDNPGVLASMSHAITSLGVNIGNVNLKRLSNGRGLARLEVMVGTLDQLERVIYQLRKEEGILSVTRR